MPEKGECIRIIHEDLNRKKIPAPEARAESETQVVNKKMPVEYPTVEVSFDELDAIDFEATNPAVYNIDYDGVLLEILVHYKSDQERAVIFGTGFVDRSKNKLPYYNRHSWSGEIDATCIHYSDPTLRLSEKGGLFWCYGRNDDWYLERIAVVLAKILDNMGIRISDTLFFGSSGGGFTSIMLATLLGSRATVINPQLILSNYKEKPLSELRRVCLREGEELLPERIDVVKLFLREGYYPQLHIFENEYSEGDIETQLNPFLSELAEFGIDSSFLTITKYFHRGAQRDA